MVNYPTKQHQKHLISAFCCIVRKNTNFELSKSADLSRMHAYSKSNTKSIKNFGEGANFTAKGASIEQVCF
jgi:hypothetical protein